jgi:hypothetical protein
VPFIQLNRQFVEWDNKDPAEADSRFLMGRLNGSLDWPTLLKRHRVVILAEAGSGKSNELTAQAELQSNAGNYAFCTTVQTSRGTASSALRIGRSLKPGGFSITGLDIC